MDTGAIRSDEVYSLSEVKKRLGLGTHALRMARIKGLEMRKVGRRKFILGADLIAFIDQQGREPA